MQLPPPLTTVPAPRPRPTSPGRPATSAPRNRAERLALTAELLVDAGGCDARRRQQLLHEVVVLNMSVANAVASRYRTRGIAADDLQQVAYLALVKAANGFDADSGHDFLSYAVPTIRGEIKRHFRDQGWMVRPPRRIQELQARIAGADSALSQSLGRSPRPTEVADFLVEDVAEVREALATDGCFTPSSLDRPVGLEGDTSLGDLLGTEDWSVEAVDARVVLAPVVSALGERDRRILMLRFFRGWTQREIADDIGVTQMQVSRLLTRILGTLRQELNQLGLDSADRRTASSA